MLTNIFPRTELVGFSKAQSRGHDLVTERKELEAEMLEAGWHVQRRNKKSIVFSRPKKKAVLLESRVWTLFYKMGFLYLSGKGGCFLSIPAKGKGATKDQIDVVGIDSEVVIAVECKSFEKEKKDPTLPNWLSRFGGTRSRLADGVRKANLPHTKRHIGMVAFTWDLNVTDTDKARAEEHKVLLFDEKDLTYYENLTNHLGAAARFQFLADVFGGKQINGLEVKVPALRTKQGRIVSYTFSLRPDYLLKISYVAHRAKGGAYDLDMYQRMVMKSRLKSLSEYISNGGSFPTNVVVNIRNKKFVEFQQSERGEQEGASFGWLTIRPAYGCAWVIDGQHRLYSYSGNPRAATSYLSILAYEALSSGAQAQMFVDINSEQRKVPRNLLVELDAQLKWEAPEIEDRIQAIVSRAGIALDQDFDSPLRSKIMLADDKRSSQRCISLTTLSSALVKTGFFIVGKKKDHVQYGPLWRNDPTDTLKRVCHVLKMWFHPIAEKNLDWWTLGADEGGGLAMNNGVTICINVLRSVFDYLGPSSLISLDNNELAERIRPYAECLANHFARMNLDERKQFRQLQGSDGQTTGTRQCQEALHQEFPSYKPPSLLEWIESRKKNSNEEGRRIITEIETTLQKYILQIVKAHYDSDPDAWWWEGIPRNVRKKINDRMNDSDGESGDREQNFDLIHYREIIMYNWSLLGDIFGYRPGGNGKEKRTAWIVDICEMRNIVMHPSRQQFLNPNNIQELVMYRDWINDRVNKLEYGVEEFD